MCTTPQAERNRARRNPIDAALYRIDLARGSLRATRDLTVGDGLLPKSNTISFLQQDDFVSFCDLLIEQLEQAAEHLLSTPEEIQS